MLLAGCQMFTARRRDVRESAFRPSERPVTVDSVSRNDRLAELAKAQHPRILATYGGEYSDPKLERMVAKVVGSLTTVSGNPTQTYRITILNSPNVNAFALPGGYLYVTRGLLALANDSAELAAVIAHEMGHVTANHGLQRQQKEAEEVLATKVVTDVLGESPTAKAALIRGKLRLAQFSRNQELEADAIGIKAAGRPATIPMRPAASCSRWRPIAISARSAAPPTPAWTSWRAIPTRRSASSWHSGMPASSARRAWARATAIPSSPASTACSSATRRKKAIVRGNTFLHPGLGISFTVPDGFVIDNSAAAVTATGPGDMAIRFDGVAIDQSTRLTDYIRSGWVAGLDECSVRAGDDQRQRGGDRARARRRLAVRHHGDPRRRPGLPAADRGAGRPAVARDGAANVGGSFRTLSAGRKGRAEAAAHPRRDRQPGQTTGSIAAAMVGVDRKLDLFRVLNAMSPGRLRFGRRQGQDHHRPVDVGGQGGERPSGDCRRKSGFSLTSADFSFSRARLSIWRTRSLEMPSVSPSASSVAPSSRQAPLAR